MVSIGYELGISVNELSNFECHLQNYTQCIREVVIFWRKKNMSETWIPVAQALHFAGLHSLEEQIIKCFATKGNVLEFCIAYIDFISSSDAEKLILLRYTLCPVSHRCSLEEIGPNTPQKKGIFDSVLNIMNKRLEIQLSHYFWLLLVNFD